MSSLIKVIGAAFMGGMLSLMVRKERPEIAVGIALITSVVVLGEVVSGMGEVIERLRRLIEECGVDIKYFTTAIKAVGMAYIAQFAAEILRDSGENAIASKVEAAGKVAILALAMPVMSSFLELCVKVVSDL